MFPVEPGTGATIKMNAKRKKSRKAQVFLRGFPLMGPIYEREDRLKRRLRLLDKQIEADGAASAARLKAAKAAAEATLTATRAAAAASLSAVEVAAAAKLSQVETAAAAKLNQVEAAAAAKLNQVEAAAAAKLSQVKAAAAERLKTIAAVGTAKLKASETDKRTAERRFAALKAHWDDVWRVAGDPGLRQPFLEFLQHLRPRRVVGHVKRRFGGMADGGYVMLDDFAGVRTAISGGIGNEVSWDLDLADRGIDIIQIDHTVDGPPVQHPRFDFRKRRLVATCEDPHDVTLPGLIASCPGDDQSVICKLDIEGGEWDILAQPVPGLRRCRQIVLEFHALGKFSASEWRDRAMGCLEQLTAAHQCIHVHGNNAVTRSFTIVGGIPFPSVLEATFVLRDRYDFEEETDAFPTALDAPNTAKRAELFLGRVPSR
jgi:hypothetical protein